MTSIGLSQRWGSWRIMPALGSDRLWCENRPCTVVLGPYRCAEAARTGPRTLRQQQSWRRVESDPTRVRRSDLLARGGAGHAEKVLGSRLLFSPGQPRPSEKIGRASTRGVSKHKPGAFELTHSPRHHITYYSVLWTTNRLGYGPDNARGILLMRSMQPR